jgi:hypothetical protein
LAVLAVVAFTAAVTAHAHSASDAYLTLDVVAADQPAANTVVRAQWDIALRDLNFVLGLDADGDGSLRWGELRKRWPEVTRYALDALGVRAGDASCTMNPTRQLVAEHPDGAYAALFFDIVCRGRVDVLTLDYRLFFAVDPSHRGILVFRSGGRTATALFAPDNARIALRR